MSVATERQTVIKVIVVTVNGRPVIFRVHKATGLEIKQTAITQKLCIQEDFVLFEVQCNAPLKQIGDCDVVDLFEGQIFRATAPDDNS